MYKSAESSWLSDKIETKKIRSYLNLLHRREEVLELHSIPKKQLESGLAAFKKDVVAIQKDSIDKVVSNFAEVERWTTGMSSSSDVRDYPIDCNSRQSRILCVLYELLFQSLDLFALFQAELLGFAGDTILR